MFKVLGRDVNLRVEAALWEFKKNKSVDNARLHLQLGLRLFPESHLLWITLFRIEILNVKRLLKRRDVLAGKYSKRRGEALESEEIGEGAAEEQGIISDTVLNLKLAEIVAEQALNSPEVTEKNVLLYRLWQTANEYGVVAKRLEDILYEKLWSEGNICEESFIAKHERQKDETDVYGIYDEAIARFPTSRMFRYYIEICEERIVADDVFAGAKLRDIYKLMEEKGLAGMEDYKKLLELEGDNSEKERIVERALQRFHSSSFLWSRLLRLKMSDGKTSKRDIQKLFNDAERALKSEDMLEIYELAIDWAIQNAPSTVDAIFQRAVMLTPCDVSSEIKCIRLRYLKAAYPSDPSVYRNEYSKICAAPPNAMVVHKAFIKLERELKEPDDKLIVRAMENCVADFGYEDYKCWIEYAKYLFNHDPPALASLYQRAIVCVPKEQSDAFVTEWTRLLQHTSKQPHQKRPIKNRKIKKGISNKAEKRPKLSS
ncbi:U3 small nucleolar RNA-associated protein 6 -like protein [Toxocara canis]|uniref:U3 small nucleolar RNA-associated protein 6-like protein n=1 Tax=Toxocara canis TaxID=6265 RepID=A0A0B2UW81_TOXCA|nr:U3 small nucleolar RNA-associated protein 6 -like protein [Toxocara canis]